jgi:DNA-binding LacI/PurR family transcriptional regulator
MHEAIRNASEKTKPAYLHIVEEIAKDIEDGIYKAGDRIPSSKELSLRYRIHRNSILPVFKILKSARLLEIRKGIGMVVADHHDPRPVIAMILPKDFYKLDSLFDGAKEICAENKAKLELITYASQAEQDEIIMELGDSKYTAAILHQSFSDECELELSRLKNKLEFPISLLGRPDQLDTGIWQIERNEFHAGYIAAEHLLERRFARIAVVVSGYSYDVAFLNGYLQAMREFKASVNEDYIEYLEDEDAPGDATRKLLSMEKKPPKAVIYAHSKDAVIGLDIMKFRDIVPGKDIGVVCLGDFEGAGTDEPTITVIKHNHHEIGRKAAKLIFTYLAADQGRNSFQFEKVNPELLERSSSLKNGKEPICLSELQRQKRGLARDRQKRIDKYWRDVYHPGWWKTEPLGWEREELYYKYLYNDW